MHRIFLAIPLMDEWENLSTLISDIHHQSFRDFTAVFCVNQPDHWWQLPGKHEVCENNKKSLSYLASCDQFPIVVIDKASPGKGWKGKEYGVGWARKVTMDTCVSLAGLGDLIISLDGDTRFGPAYLESVFLSMQQHPKAVALSVPYYHNLTGKPNEDRAILRYEIYMRYYSLNLWRINCPYSFTALGSAMAFPVSSYRAIRGMTPNKSGEDFYFLQKLRKYGPVLYWNPEKVYPAARFSDRVFFGTGPAMIKGNEDDWSSYPLYATEHYDNVARTYSLFPDLFDQPIETPMDAFLTEIFKEPDLWEPLRANHPNKERFIRACYEKVDGLRILQYLKSNNAWGNSRDELHLKEYFLKFAETEKPLPFMKKDTFSFSGATVEELNTIRDVLANLEEKCQMDHYQKFNI